MIKNERSNVPLEVTSALLTPAALVGFIRVFETTGTVIFLIAVALFSSLVAAGLRRLKVALPIAGIASTAIFLLFATNRFAGETLTLFVIPSGETLAVAQSLWSGLTVGFDELVAPVPAADFFVLPSMAVAWAMAFLTDWGALRLRLAFEPVLPAGLIFVFATFLGFRSDPVTGTNDHSFLVSSIFVAATLMWAVAQRSANLGENNVWLAGQRRPGVNAVAVTGAVLGSVAIIAGIIMAPAIPGANGEPRVELNEGSQPPRAVESPIVDIERQLGPEQRDDVIFTVHADSPRYWRSAGLDTYQGNQWIIEGKFKKVGDGKTLSGGRSTTDTKETVTQTFELTAATNIWVPAAYEPLKVSDQTAEVTWNEDSESLTVPNDVPSTNGLVYTVESDAPLFSGDQLRAVDESVPANIAEQYLALPDIPPSVVAMAEEVTGQAATRYDKMIALQTYFREFTYSLDRPSPEPGLDPLENFLFQRIGFCQQFAGTFAVMARALGHPARVATGYTWGTASAPDEEGFSTYTVRGRQAHAWPEVYFGELGWVSFEPTPGRGSPDAQHTGVTPTQDTATGENSALPEQPAPAEAAEAAEAAETPATTTPATAAATPDSTDASGGAAVEDPGRNIPIPPVWVWLPLLLIVGYLGGVPLVRRIRQKRRMDLAASPTTPPHVAAAIAWTQVENALGFVFKVSRRPSETKTEFARRLKTHTHVDHEPLERLATLNTRANYHPAGLSQAQVAESLDLSNSVTRQTNSYLPVWAYWSRVLSPVRVLSRVAQTLRTLSSDSKKIEQVVTARPIS